MKAWNYYNEIDAGAAALIVEMIKRGVIAPGVVDTRILGWRAFGNAIHAIHATLAAEVIASLSDVLPEWRDA